MLHWARVSAVYWTSLHTIRWERQPNNFPFPNREIILGRCLALLVLCKGCFTGLTGTSRHLANGSVQACIHPKTHASQSLPNMYPAGDSGFSLEKFPGLSSWTLPYRPLKTGLPSLSQSPLGGSTSPLLGCYLPAWDLLNDRAHSIISRLGCQLFAVHIDPLDSVRITEEAGN